MSEKQDSLFNGSTTTIATILAGLVSLGLIMGWKIDAANMAQAQIIRQEVERKYVSKEIFCLQMDNFNEKLKSIGKAVGAKMKDN